MRRRRKTLLAIATLGLILLAVDQAVLFLALSDGRFRGEAVAPYFPPQFAEGGTEEVPLKEHPRLGWLPAEPGYTGHGGRAGHPKRPSRKRPGVTRVLLLGSSVAYGVGVLPEETFAARLDASFDTLEILNHAVPYFGPDQIHLFREELSGFDSDEVWLAFEPRTARYAMTGYLPLARRDMRVDRFKPQVVTGAEEWTVVPRASREVLTDREKWQEFLRTDGLAGEAGSEESAFGVPGFGEHFAITRLLATWSHARRFEEGAILHEPENRNYRTVMQFLLRADRETSDAGIRLRVLILPHRTDFEHLGWRTFIDDLRSHGVEVLDLTGSLGVQGGAGNASLWTGSGTWSSEAHAKVATELGLRFGSDLTR